MTVRPDLTPDYEVVQRCVRFERSEMVINVVAYTGWPALFRWECDDGAYGLPSTPPLFTTERNRRTAPASRRPRHATLCEAARATHGDPDERRQLHRRGALEMMR